MPVVRSVPRAGLALWCVAGAGKGAVRGVLAVLPGGSLAGGSDRGKRLPDVGAHDLGAEDGLVEVELAVQLLHHVRLGGQVDDGVDALGVLVDLVAETTTSPDVDLLDGPAALTDDVEERLERGSDGALLEVGSKMTMSS